MRSIESYSLKVNSNLTRVGSSTSPLHVHSTVVWATRMARSSSICFIMEGAATRQNTGLINKGSQHDNLPKVCIRNCLLNWTDIQVRHELEGQ
jgi:hypothetical protein